MTKDDVKKWMEDHEAEIKTGIKLAVGVTLAVVIGKKLHGIKTSVEPTKTIEYKGIIPPIKERVLPELLVKNGFEIYTDGKNFMEFADYGTEIPEMTIEAMHEALEAIKSIDGFTDKSRIQAMFNVYNLDVLE